MRRFPRPVLCATLLYVALTVVLTWPLVLHPGSVVPNDLGDPLLNTWLLAWNARVPPLTERWWNATQFFPIAGVTAFSEHLLGLSVLVTPVILASGNALLGYNVAFFLSFPLSALAAYFLTWTIARRHDAALVAGLAFGFAPYRMAQFAHVQVLSSYWMPVALAALHRYYDGRQARWLALFAAGFLMQALACGYYLIYLTVLIGLWVLWFGRRRWADLLKVVLTVALCALALAPVLLNYWRIQHGYGMRRGIDEITSFSADVASLLKAPDTLRVWGWLNVVDRPESALFPGLTVVLLIVVALCLRWRDVSGVATVSRTGVRWLVAGAAVFGAIAISPLVVGPWKLAMGGLKLLSVASPHKPLSIAVLCTIVVLAVHPSVRTAWQRRSALTFYTLAAAAMWLLSLGPEPTLMESPILYKAPYAWLMAFPGVDGVRVPARFWMLAALCLAVAAGLALVRVRERWPSLKATLPILACVGVLADGWPGPLQLLPPPDPRPSHTEAEIRFDLPLDHWHDLLTLYRSIDHRRTTVNGYSGYFAPHYWVLKYLVAERDPQVLGYLTRLGAMEISIDHVFDPAGDWRKYVAASADVRLAYSDDRTSAYFLPRRAGVAVRPRLAGDRLQIASIAASTKPELVASMTDNDVVSRWHTGRSQWPGDRVIVDLGQSRDTTGAELLIGGYATDFPRGLQIETSADGQTWTPVWSGAPAIIALAGALEEPRTSPLTFAWPSRPARHLRFTQTASDPTFYWSVAELRIVGR